MEFTAHQIAELLNGKVEGDPKVTVNTIAKIEDGSSGSLTFLYNPKYTPHIYNTNCSIVLVNNNFIAEKEIKSTLIRVENAYIGLAKILELYNEMKLKKVGISDKCSIEESAIIGKDVYIGDFVYIGENVEIGDEVKIYPGSYIGDFSKIGGNTTLFAGVKIYDSTIIGKNCTFHAGVVIGGDGFGFAPQENQNYKKISQIGNVIIGDNVEMGANSTIDRATIGSTIISSGVKLDNFVQIAHNCEIGENTVIAAQTGVAGSTKIGKNCLIAAQVGIVGHNKIGDNVIIGAQSGVPSNVKDGAIILGSPAFDASKCRKTYVHMRNLPDIVKRIDELERKLNNK